VIKKAKRKMVEELGNNKLNKIRKLKLPLLLSRSREHNRMLLRKLWLMLLLKLKKRNLFGDENCQLL
jgi:hypothetical protein